MADSPIDPKVVMGLGIAAAANALAIVEEATLLADAGHDARAFSLSVLAVEELAKAWIANIGIHYSDEEGVEREVRKLLRALKGSTIRITPPSDTREPDRRARPFVRPAFGELVALPRCFAIDNPAGIRSG